MLGQKGDDIVFYSDTTKWVYIMDTKVVSKSWGGYSDEEFKKRAVELGIQHINPVPVEEIW
jgi:hypothetical protein